MTTRRKLALAGLGTVFVVIQGFGPVRTNPPVIASHTLQSQVQIPARVADILNHSCMDCHSYETHWTMLGRIAPVSWWFVDNVNQGRGELNFSEWTKYRPSYAIATMDAIGEAAAEKAMPPVYYEEFHAHGRLTDDERKILYDWAMSTRYQLQVDLLDHGKVPKVATQ